MPNGEFMTTARSHIPELDGLRGVAVILVLLAHSTMVFVRVPLFTAWLDRYGSLGVQIFFVLSGFLITRILLETRGSSHFFSSFFARRGLRIYPLYYGVFAFVVLSGIVHQHGVHWWVYALYLSNLVYGHQPQPAPLAPVWSLAVEEQFYLVWPFVVFLVSRRVLQRILFVVIALTVFLRFTGLLYPHNTLLQLDALSIGALIACRVDGIGSWRKSAAFLAWLMPLGMGFGDNAVLNSLSQTIQVVSAAALLVILLDENGRASWLFRAPALRYVGTISYGVYLLHSFVFSAFLRLPFFTRAVDSGSLFQAVLFLVLEYALVIVVASASFFFFERPFLLLKRFFTAESTSSRRKKEESSVGPQPERTSGIADLSAKQIPTLNITYCDTALAERGER
jgi:peptidoglycan/LPS O-acetylase OafA/YrhL